jgi:PAS domain S-box-containing protein
LSCEIVRVNDREHFEYALEHEEFDVVLCDYNLPSYDGLSALRLVRAKKPDLPVVLVSGSIGEEEAVRCLHQGATDYLIKERLERLTPAVKRALEEADLMRKRREAAAQLQESEERTRLVIDTALDAVITLNEEGRITSWNHQAEELFGWTREEMVGQEAPETIIPQRLRGAHNRRFKQAVESGSAVNRRMELTAFNRRGEEFPIELAISSYRANGRLSFSAFIRDISERKRAEKRIHEQAALLDKARDAIIVRDLQQRIIYWNNGAERLYGWKADEVIGKTIFEVIYKGVSAQEEEALKSVQEQGEWSGDVKQWSRDGKQLIVESRRTLLRDADGKPQSVLVINTDVTEKKHLEEQFLRAQRMETIGALAGGVAHDLNNVLAPILMASEMLHDEAANDFSRKMLDTIKSSAQRGSEIVRQILSFARGNTPEKSVLQVKHLIKELAKLAKQTFPKSIKIASDVPNDLWPINGDATQVDQVLMNLFVNARDAMEKEGGTLSITAENIVLMERANAMLANPASGPYVILSVADTGCGIPPETLSRIFEPFFTTKQLGKGTGLGLSTVAAILKAHSGFAEVSSTPGKGTEFKIYFPAIESAAASAKVDELSELPQGQGEWILLVDDEQAFLEMSRVMLASYNYHVLTAGNGADALRLFTENAGKISVLITDMMMPGIGGPALIRAARSVKANLPVIITTGLSSENVQAGPERSELTSTLTKPFKLEGLLSTIRQSIQRGAERN